MEKDKTTASDSLLGIGSGMAEGAVKGVTLGGPTLVGIATAIPRAIGAAVGTAVANADDADQSYISTMLEAASEDPILHAVFVANDALTAQIYGRQIKEEERSATNKWANVVGGAVGIPAATLPKVFTKLPQKIQDAALLGTQFVKDTNKARQAGQIGAAIGITKMIDAFAGEDTPTSNIEVTKTDDVTIQPTKEQIDAANYATSLDTPTAGSNGISVTTTGEGLSKLDGGIKVSTTTGNIHEDLDLDDLGAGIAMLGVATAAGNTNVDTKKKLLEEANKLVKRNQFFDNELTPNNIDRLPLDVKLEAVLTDKEAIGDYLSNGNDLIAAHLRVNPSAVASKLFDTGFDPYTQTKFNYNGRDLVNKIMAIKESVGGPQVYQDFINAINARRELANRARTVIGTSLENLNKIKNKEPINDYLIDDLKSFGSNVDEMEANLRSLWSQSPDEQINALRNMPDYHKVPDKAKGPQAAYRRENAPSHGAYGRYFSGMVDEETGQVKSIDELLKSIEKANSNPEVIALMDHYYGLTDQPLAIGEKLGLMNKKTNDRWRKNTTVLGVQGYAPGIEQKNITKMQALMQKFGIEDRTNNQSSFGNFSARGTLPGTGIQNPVDPIEAHATYLQRAVKSMIQQHKINVVIENNPSMFKPIGSAFDVTDDNIEIGDELMQNMLGKDGKTFRGIQQNEVDTDSLIISQVDGKVQAYQVNPMVKAYLVDGQDPSGFIRSSIRAVKNLKQELTTGKVTGFSIVSAMRGMQSAMTYAGKLESELDKIASLRNEALGKLVKNMESKAVKGKAVKGKVYTKDEAKLIAATIKGIEPKYSEPVINVIQAMKDALSYETTKAQYDDALTQLASLERNAPNDPALKDLRSLIGEMRRKMQNNRVAIMESVAGTSKLDVISTDPYDASRTIVGSRALTKFLNSNKESFISKYPTFEYMWDRLKIIDNAFREAPAGAFAISNQEIAAAKAKIHAIMKGIDKAATPEEIAIMQGNPIDTALLNSLTVDRILPTSKNRAVNYGMGKAIKVYGDIAEYAAITLSSIYKQLKNAGMIEQANVFRAALKYGAEHGDWDGALSEYWKRTKEARTDLGRYVVRHSAYIGAMTAASFAWNNATEERRRALYSISPRDRNNNFIFILNDNEGNMGTLVIPVEQNFLVGKTLYEAGLQSYLGGLWSLKNDEMFPHNDRLSEQLAYSFQSMYGFSPSLPIDVLAATSGMNINLDPVSIAKGKFITPTGRNNNSGADSISNKGRFEDATFDKVTEDVVSQLTGAVGRSLIFGLESGFINNSPIDGARDFFYTSGAELGKINKPVAGIVGLVHGGAFNRSTQNMYSQRVNNANAVLNAISEAKGTILDPIHQNKTLKTLRQGSLAKVDNKKLAMIAYMALPPKDVAKVPNYGNFPEVPNGDRILINGLIKTLRELQSLSADTQKYIKTIQGSPVAVLPVTDRDGKILYAHGTALNAAKRARGAEENALRVQNITRAQYKIIRVLNKVLSSYSPEPIDISDF